MSNMSDKTQSEFLKAYDELADAIYRHCFFRVYNREVARDLVQETFVKTWEYLADGGEIRQMKPFIYRVANNLVIDYSRKKKETSLETLMEKGFDLSRSGDHPPQAWGGVGGEVGKNLDYEAVINMVKKLEEPYRSAVTMRYIDDLNPREIAEIIGESENVVSVRIHRGIRKLRAILNEN